jgi:tetratricopeptide (TPR) repeat protein
VPLRDALKTALASIDESFRNQPLVEARLRLTLGMTYWYLGEPNIAVKQYERARALYTQHRGPAHADALSATHNLALGLATLNRHRDAIPLYEETVAHSKETLGPDHRRTLLTMHNLANSYYAMDRLDDALKLNEETLALLKAALGPDDPDTLMNMNSLGNNYLAKKRLDDALKMHEETLPRMIAVRGPDHTDTFSSMSSLATVYGVLNRHEDALNLREKVVKLREGKLGRTHVETLKAMNNLAASYQALNRYEDALKLHREILEARKVKLGPDNFFTLRSMHNVSHCLMKLDRGAEAIPIIDDCVRLSAGKDVDKRLIPWDMDNRLRHFEKSKDAAGCRATAEIWDKLNRTDAESLYTAAVMRAVTAAVIELDAKTPKADAAKLANEQADKALAWLKKATAAGYKNVHQLKTDKDLDPLRKREDFKNLIFDLEQREKE